MTKKNNPFFGLKFDNAMKKLSKVTQEELARSFEDEVEEDIRATESRAKEARDKIKKGIRKAGGRLPL